LKKVVDLKTIMHDLKYNCFPMMGMCTRLVPVLLVGETERPNSNKGMSIISPWSISCTFALQISHTSFKSSPSKLQFATLWHRGDYCYTIAKGIRIEGHQYIKRLSFILLVAFTFMVCVEIHGCHKVAALNMVSIGFDNGHFGLDATTNYVMRNNTINQLTL
jgi:hypothetical protein